MSEISSALRATPKRVAGQGAILFAGFTAAQALSFARNAVLGHVLSKGDFGIAATITLILQLVESLSDLGADRLIVQAPDGDDRHFVAASQSVLVLRGLILGLLLLVSGPPVANFFAVPDAAAAFQIVALVPFLKGFLHLGFRQAQRRFDNKPLLLIEVVPQMAALLVLPIALAIDHDYRAVVWLSLAQAFAAVVVSHLLSQAPYALAFDARIIKRQLAFGWPILLSALPLVAVYQGDRIIIGRVAGMEALAGYTVAFMATMVPGLVASKVGHSLMLPMFSEALLRGRSIDGRFKSMTETTVLAAAVYVAVFLVSGPTLIPLVFGSQYHDLGAVTAWLSTMWALRMVQAVPGMALMAHGITKPFAVAGFVRAASLPFALAAAVAGGSMATIAALGCLFEFASFAYIAIRTEMLVRGLGQGLVLRTLFLIPVALTAKLATLASPSGQFWNLSQGALIAGFTAAVAVAIMPALRTHLRAQLVSQATTDVA